MVDCESYISVILNSNQKLSFRITTNTADGRHINISLLFIFFLCSHLLGVNFRLNSKIR